jgi:hypothetical protein
MLALCTHASFALSVVLRNEGGVLDLMWYAVQKACFKIYAGLPQQPV